MAAQAQAQKFLVLTHTEDGRIRLYKISAQSSNDAKERTIRSHARGYQENVNANVFALAEYDETIHDPMSIGGYAGEFLAKARVAALEKQLLAAYKALMETGDYYDARNDVGRRDYFYNLVPRDAIGNEAFKLHTGVERTGQTV